MQQSSSRTKQFIHRWHGTLNEIPVFAEAITPVCQAISEDNFATMQKNDIRNIAFGSREIRKRSAVV
jgi:hypothetical protein